MFQKGMDISTLLEVEENNGKYYDFNAIEPEDLLTILNRYQINSIRLRLWHNPYDENHNPYLAGTCDLNRVIQIASRAKKANMNIMLDFHYSDFWCDPSKQTLPKAWVGLTDDELALEIYLYTKEVLLKLKSLDLAPKFIQIGNEITNGMLWPNAYLDGTNEKYDTLASFLKAGIKATKEILPEAKTILHLERSGDNQLYRKWLDEIVSRNVDYDILGVSYYPYWHGDLKALEDNLLDVKNRYQKDIMIVETSYGFTFDTYLNSSLVVSEESFNKLENKPIYPISIEGQEDFLKDLFLLAKKLGIKGIYYWEPGWLPVANTSWASEEAREYINEAFKKGGNEWANQALFDYEGKALPALKVFMNEED